MAARRSTLDLDDARVARTLANVNYRGYVSLEMKEQPDAAVEKRIDRLRRSFAL